MSWSPAFRPWCAAPKNTAWANMRMILCAVLCDEQSGYVFANLGGNYFKTEWETGYMLRDLDGGQVVVA